MSSTDESKPQINSIENILKFNLKIKTEDLGPVSPPKRWHSLEETQNRRLLTPSKLSFNKCNESPNKSMTLSAKRVSEDGEESPISPNKELSPLFKRIKKENNNCLLLDSKQFIKQELDTELDFNSRQPFVGLFSKLSLDRTGIPESSHSQSLTTSSTLSEANDLSDVLKQLNICHKSNQNCDQNTSSSANPKLKKKKNKKSKKSREKKTKTLKNIFKTVYNSKSKIKSTSLSHKKDQKTHHLFKFQSNVIKELKVSASGGLSADEVQSLMALKNEGIVRKHRKAYPAFKCLLCAQRFAAVKSAEEHITSDIHLRNKSEQRFSRYDSILALDWGQSHDIEKLLARRRLLAQMSNKTKEVLHSKGIRVADGFGSQAFVCIDCRNESFESLEAVFDHINTKSRLLEGLNHISLESGESQSAAICDNFEDVLHSKPDLKRLFDELSLDQLNQLFDSESIIKRVHKRSKSKRLKYFCNLCTKYRNTDYDMFKHINDLSHRSVKTRNDFMVQTKQSNAPIYG